MAKKSESTKEENQLRLLAVLNDVFSNLILETTLSGMLQRLLEGGMYITRAESGIAFCRFSEEMSAFSQVGLQITEKEAESARRALASVSQSISGSSSNVELYRDARAFASLSPPLPPIGAARGMGLLLGKRRIGFLVLCHSDPQFDFRGGESALIQLVIQAGLMAERFDLFAQIQGKSKALEEANRHLTRVLVESEEKNRRLSEAYGAIERSKAELEAFVYTASHDLKAPVVSLHGMASALIEDYGKKLDEQGRHYLDRLMANADFMERLIADLLELSRVGRRERKPRKLQTERIVQDVLDQCREAISKGRVQIALRSPLPEVTFDQMELSQIFLNLIGNAVKFMGDQPSPMIEIGGRRIEGQVEFYVKDNGIGIDPQYHEQIFGVFQRLKEVEVEGSGIGLAIVKKIINLSGGTIRVESKKGSGATFFFRIPA